jgi:DNA (cytosine-5)-methyltransferase 1
MRPRLLDLFCGAGGAAVGYHRAGFEVVGIDIEPQPNYPFEFWRGDALKVVEIMVDGGGLQSAIYDRDWAAIHASPPCQAFSGSQVIRGREHPDLITPLRPLLEETGLSWVIENVEGAPLRPDYRLCGTMFNLGIPSRGYLKRHRIFETSFEPPDLSLQCQHPYGLRSIGVYGHTGSKATGNTSGNHGWLVADWREAMGIDWMTRDELAQAIPPAYTEHIGLHLMEELKGAKVA